MASRWILLLCLFPSLAFAAEPAAPPLIHAGDTFPAADTLDCGDESTSDAKECLDNLIWTPTKFSVTIADAQPGCGDFLIRFPSARPIGDTTIDKVSLEWFAARGDDKAIRRVPAVVVVHESGRQMTVGRLIARGLGAQGVHAFLVHMPGFGLRRVTGFPAVEQIMPAMHAAIADVRRARDAVAALPVIDRSAIGLQGTSLGGFVAAAVAGVDHGYNRVFILLAGGNLEEVLFHGSNEVAKARSKLSAAGISDEQIRMACAPARAASTRSSNSPGRNLALQCQVRHRRAAPMFAGAAKAAHLSDDHFVEFAADHYSGVVYLPIVVEQISQRMRTPRSGQPPNVTAKKEHQPN